MNINQLEKVQKLFNRVKELDVEIIGIEKMAELIANKKSEIKLCLKVNDLEKETEDKNKVSFDEDGSLTNSLIEQMRRAAYGVMYIPAASCSDKPKKEYTMRQDFAISDNVALQVLGVMLAEKMQARKLALKALNKIGIES